MVRGHFSDSKSILVVDDDVSTRSLIADALSETGQFITKEAGNGIEALEILREKPYDIVISDIQMPGMSGLELLANIMEVDPATYMILITGYPTTDICISAMKMGAVDFLPKPFDIDDLLFKVNLYLRERAALRNEDIVLKADQTRLNNKIKELSKINYIYDSIESMRGENDQIFQEIVSFALKIADAESCSLVLFDEENDKFNPRVVKGPSSNYCCKNQIPSPINSIFKEVVRNKEAVLINSHNTETYSSVICAPLMIRDKVFGILNLNDKINGRKFTQKDLDYILSLTTRASLNIENKILYESVYTNIIDTFKSLITSIHVRDHYTERHSVHVTELAVKTAKALKCSNNEIESLNISAMLHDIGKIAVPDKILLKEGRLTDEEYTIIKGHPVIGENILKPVMLIDVERKIIRHHHERWDGKGYPDRLSGEDIPFLSRILSVADSFDAMTTNRPYRSALKIDEAVSELQRNRNLQFDKDIVDTFISSI